MVHAVSLSPHAQKFVRRTSKSENHVQNSDGMQTKLKLHAVSMTPHARSTNDLNGPGSLKMEYLSKTNMFPNCPTPPLKNIEI
jgi:hypothetical protein